MFFKELRLTQSGVYYNLVLLMVRLFTIMIIIYLPEYHTIQLLLLTVLVVANLGYII